MKSFTSYQRTAIVISISLGVLFLGCCLWILLSDLTRSADNTKYTAYIYQAGELLHTYDLWLVEEEQELIIYSKKAPQEYNTVTLKHNQIGITAASCPDHLCIKRGYLKTDLLPIICLPNDLVIEVKPATVSYDGQAY